MKFNSNYLEFNTSNCVDMNGEKNNMDFLNLNIENSNYNTTDISVIENLSQDSTKYYPPTVTGDYVLSSLTQEKINDLYANMPADLLVKGLFGYLKTNKTIKPDGKIRNEKLPCNSKGEGVDGLSNGKSFEEVAVVNKNVNAISLVLTRDNEEFGAIDLDHCMKNGNVDPECENYELIKRIITKVGSYSEISMSGNGCHIYFGMSEGKPEELNNKRKGVFEFYLEKHVIGMTGNRIVGTPAHLRYLSRDEIRDLYVEMGLNIKTQDNECGGNITTPSSIVSSKYYEGLADTKSIEEVNDKLREYRKTTLLLEGKWNEAGYNSKSEGDIALAYYAAIHSNCDWNVIYSVMMDSELYYLDCQDKRKWDREDYLERTINNAIDMVCHQNPDMARHVKEQREQQNTEVN